MASGHVNRANRGRTHGRTDQCCTRQESPCQLGAVHTWPLASISECPLFRRLCGLSGHRRDCQCRAPPTEIGFRVLGSTNFCHIRAQQIRSDFIRRLWQAEKMPLTFIAIVKAEEFELFGCLYALGNHVDGKVSRKKDY